MNHAFTRSVTIKVTREPLGQPLAISRMEDLRENAFSEFDLRWAY